MGTIITGRDPAAATWLLQSKVSATPLGPSGYTVTGGTAIAVLGDGSDATYVAETNCNNYFRANCAPFVLPAGARLFYIASYVRARLTAGNTKNKDFVIMFGDHSNPKVVRTDRGAADVHVQLTSSLQSYGSKSVLTNSLGKIYGQNDIQKGIYVFFGLNTVYGNLANGAVIAEAYMRYQYDLPPSATIVSPTPGGTVNDSASPVITWDYTDDFQPQAKYQLSIVDNATS